MKTVFKESEMPVKSFEKIGLFQNGKYILSDDNLNALLAGRRTDLIALSDIKADNFTIKHIDAKLSLLRESSGIPDLLIHPIYKEVRKHDLLNDFESEQLIKGKFTHLEKQITTPDGKPKSKVIEYDSDTREFISYDPEEVIAPDKVNGQKLSSSQKESFKKGDIVDLADGTHIQHRANESKGILSDNKMLLLSVLLDGGISYLLVRGVKNLRENTSPQKDQTEAFERALKEMTPSSYQLPQQSRGYSKNHSR